MKKVILIFSLVIPTSSIKSMDRLTNINNKIESKKTKVLAIPDANDMGSEADYIAEILGENQVRVKKVYNPKWPDLGQDKCIKYLKYEIDTSNKTEKIIIHATGQGTATALNYLGDDKDAHKIDGLILESVIASGNQYIIDLLKSSNSTFVNWPLAYYWLPYISMVRCFVPSYSPSGKQAIKSIRSIPINIPVIIINTKRDTQAYDAASALYYGLKEHGNYVYLIGDSKTRSVRLIESLEEKNLIQSILKNHKLIKGKKKQEETDLSVTKPDRRLSKKIYDDLLSKEYKHEGIKLLVISAIVVIVGSVLIIIVCKVLIKVMEEDTFPDHIDSTTLDEKFLEQEKLLDQSILFLKKVG